MPYNEPERKRQWEKNIARQRNARRRKPLSNYSPEPSGKVVPLADSNSAQPVTSANIAIGATTGAALLFTLFIVIWRLGGSIDPVVST